MSFFHSQAAAPASRPGEGPEVPPPYLSADDPINILIVDDEPRNLTVLETVLDDRAYCLIRAGSGDEALLALIAHEFALLILDVSMPGMNGFELAKLIKQRKRSAHVPIIFLTAFFNEDQHVMEAYGTGAVDYLHKPLNAAVLRSKVSVFADLHRKTRDIEVANRTLNAEVLQRRHAEQQLRDLNESLDRQVTRRTVEVRENEARLRHAADAAGLTYVEVDFILDKVRWAENFPKVMGYPAPPSLGTLDSRSGTQLLLDHVAPPDRVRVESAFQQASGGQPYAALDFRVLGDDHVERWIQSELFSEFEPDGTLRKSFRTHLDITDRKNAQEELRRSEEGYRQLADSMPQMVWTARADGYLDYYNARWREFTGFGPERYGYIVNWEPLLHPDDMEPCYGAWFSSLQSGEEFQAEYRLWDRRANHYCWHLGRALPVRHDGGRIVKWIGTCTDIDAQKRAAEEIGSANQTLEQFAFAVSHDLQEPLRDIAIYTQLLEKGCGGCLNEEAAMFMKQILKGTQRMSSLVSDLLDYTRISVSDRAIVSIVDVEGVLERVCQHLVGVPDVVHPTITHDQLPSVAIRDFHLEQLLQNLVGNAVKYRKDGEPAVVHVSAEPQAGGWHFLVRDNGIGIAPEYQDQIFIIFKRLHGPGSRYPGSGIGLSICQKIVESYGGRIWVQSELGKGATFHFTLSGQVGA